ncbi:hypothetical protein [Nocardia brasiliensis]|uniref:hypothetical protein n=1 Tax=Nocardia brasiliensis TaxID=37326 RepID=UPI0024559730|nr:hypothetical protein [Nocardia brasiliensis]
MGTDAALRVVAEDGKQLSHSVVLYLRELILQARDWKLRLGHDPCASTRSEFMTWKRNRCDEARRDACWLPHKYGSKVSEVIEMRFGESPKYPFDFLELQDWERLYDALLGMLREYETGAALQIHRKWREPPRYATLRRDIRPSIYTRHIKELNELGGALLNLDRIRRSPVGIAGSVGHWSTFHSYVARWIADCERLLACLHSVEDAPDSRSAAHDFFDLTYGWEVGGHTEFKEAPFTGACIELGIEYLSRTEENMENYIDGPTSAPSSPHYSQVFNGPVYGQAALRIKNINSSISGLVQRGDDGIAKALEAIEQAVLTDTAEDEDLRRDLLDGLEELASQAELPPEERRRGVVRSILSSFSAAATSGSQIAAALEAWGQILGGLA